MKQAVKKRQVLFPCKFERCKAKFTAIVDLHEHYLENHHVCKYDGCYQTFEGPQEVLDHQVDFHETVDFDEADEENVVNDDVSNLVPDLDVDETVSTGFDERLRRLENVVTNLVKKVDDLALNNDWLALSEKIDDTIDDKIDKVNRQLDDKIDEVNQQHSSDFSDMKAELKAELRDEM